MANFTDNAVESAVLNDNTSLCIVTNSTAEAAILNDDSTTRIVSLAVESAVLNDAVFERNPTLVRETAVLNDATLIVGNFRTNAVEVARISDASNGVMRNNAVEAAVLNDTVRLTVSSSTIDAAVLNDTAGGAQALQDLAVESAALNDAVRSILINKVSDSAVLNDAVRTSFRARNLVLEIAVLNDSALGNASKSDYAVEMAVLNDATSQHLHGSDRVIEIGYLSDYARGGAGVAWSAHVEPLAMSRYENFPFSSLALVGGVLLGTGPDGVYEMAGGTDDGAAIAAEIAHDWTDRVEGDKGTSPDPHLKRPRHVYLNARVTGVLAFVLGCVEDGAEVEYDYSLPDTTATGFVNIRAPLGRGIRSRYLRPTIRNVAGADFEINDGRIVVDSLARSV